MARWREIAAERDRALETDAGGAGQIEAAE
jgi:hypothetical protein